ncbi:MAG: hypothetical protein LUC92_05725 [Clostridiales bacterium]|nr:hypothetical protein [Clostridiales bacterium]
MTKAETVDTDSTSYYTEYKYNDLGRMTALIMRNGANTTSYIRDSFNRVAKMTDPLGNSESYTYDLNNNYL